MRTSYKNNSLSFAAIMIGGLLALGVAYASPLCCNEVTDKCLRASERALCGPATGLQCAKPFYGLRPALDSEPTTAISDFSGTTESCCMASDCGGALQTVFINSSVSQKLGTMLLAIGIEGIEIDAEKHTTQPTIAPKPLKIPLYLYIQSILC